MQFQTHPYAQSIVDLQFLQYSSLYHRLKVFGVLLGLFWALTDQSLVTPWSSFGRSWAPLVKSRLHVVAGSGSDFIKFFIDLQNPILQAGARLQPTPLAKRKLHVKCLQAPASACSNFTQRVQLPTQNILNRASTSSLVQYRPLSKRTMFLQSCRLQLPINYPCFLMGSQHSFLQFFIRAADGA